MDTGSGNSVSVWMGDEPLQRRTPLASDLEADVCVIGAGLAGLSVAYLLARAGRFVVVLEDGAIASGETSRTTAHLTNAFDNRYHRVEFLHGEDGARLVAESHTAAIHEVDRIVSEERIECQYERISGYLFVPPGESLEELEHEFEAARRAGITNVTWVERAPLRGFDTGRCLCFPDQAQFHPLRYVEGLVAGIERRRGRIFTDTHATNIEPGKDGARHRVETRQGHSVRAEHVVVATNTPINDMLTMHTKQHAYRSHVIGARVPRGAVLPALYWDTLDDYHYVRVAQLGGDHDVLIVGGEDHKTGQQHDARDRYDRLEEWARVRFPAMGEVVVRWSGQVMEPVDALAFIGLNPGDERIWVVTGDSGNGMTHGVIAGMLLRELILGHDHPWAKLYDPSRKSLRAALDYTRENLNMAAQYRSWLTSGDVGDEDDIPRGRGAVIRRGLEKYAAYRDAKGVLHRCSAVCPHLGAIVSWNSEEQTWDCPAHGSRFDAKGKVLNGPANTDLAPIEDEPAHAERTPARRARG